MDKRISDLNSVTTPSDSDLLAIVNGGETKKITYANLMPVGVGGSGLGWARYDDSQYTKVSTLSLSATGATPYDRVSKSLVFAKGNDVWENYYESFHFYADADFVANGNQWRLTADGGPVEIANIIYFIQRTFNAG